MNKLDERYQKAQEELQALEAQRVPLANKRRAIEDRQEMLAQHVRGNRYGAEILKEKTAISQQTEYQAQLDQTKQAMTEVGSESAKLEEKISAKTAEVQQLQQRVTSRDYLRLKLAALQAEQKYTSLRQQMTEAGHEWDRAKQAEEAAQLNLHALGIKLPGVGIFHPVMDPADVPAWLQDGIDRVKVDLSKLDGE